MPDILKGASDASSLSYHSVFSVFPIFHSVEAVKKLSSCRVVPRTLLCSLSLEH